MAKNETGGISGPFARGASARVNLTLRFEDNGTGHDDIVLRFGAQSWVCDSYYFALDQGILPDRKDVSKTRMVLRRLLEQWIDALDRLAEGETAFLPYDFSDETTGWLSCRRCGAELILSHGWAPLAGCSISPSRIGDHLANLSGFRVDGPTVRAPVEQVVTAIRGSLEG